MGYYVQVQKPKGKAQQLVSLHHATILPQRPEAFEDVPDDKALICVVDNGPFEAAALCYDRQQFMAFTAPDEIGPSSFERRGGIPTLTLRSEYQARGDQRPRSWVLMDKAVAHRLANYQGPAASDRQA